MADDVKKKKKDEEIPQDVPAEESAETAEAAPEPAEAAEPEVQETPVPLAEAEEKLKAEQDKFLRLAAEYDNYRKRTAKEKAELNNTCKTAVIAELLPVIDNLDRALAHNTDNPDEYKKGVEMIGSQFYAVLEKLGIESYGEAGDAFDPNLHIAVMHIEDETLAENTVAAGFAKGYRLGDKVIRPAAVQVAN